MIRGLVDNDTSQSRLNVQRKRRCPSALATPRVVSKSAVGETRRVDPDHLALTSFLGLHKRWSDVGTRHGNSIVRFLTIRCGAVKTHHGRLGVVVGGYDDKLMLIVVGNNPVRFA